MLLNRFLIFDFTDISTIVGFISVSIPFMTASGSVTGLAQEERYRVCTNIIVIILF